MSRRKREAAILELVATRPIHTQAELVEALAEHGIQITQATVSRDIKRLGLLKLPTPEGGHRYAVPEALNHPANSPAARENLRSSFRDLVVRLEAAQGIIVVRTQTGCANAVAVTIDEADIPGVVATLAGDDTIFVLPSSRPEAVTILAGFQALQ